jgi:hypothetical protein
VLDEVLCRFSLFKITRNRPSGEVKRAERGNRDLLITHANLPLLHNTPLLWIDGKEFLMRRVFLQMIFEKVVKVDTNVEASYTQRMATIL